MTWHAQLHLDHERQGERTVVHHRHSGPLRALHTLYPQGPDIAHTVVVHPPGGLVGGDALHIQVTVGAGAHGLITTPGASRFYRCPDAPAQQHTELRLDAGARLEWLPLETLCYDGCQAQNRLQVSLAPGAQLLGWDVLALGLPQADRPFLSGWVAQHLEWSGVWLERGRIAAADAALLDGPVGLAGHRCLGMLYFLSQDPLPRALREQVLADTWALIQQQHLPAGVTFPNDRVLVLRLLAPLVEPAMALLRPVWALWRQALWGLEGVAPRVWAM